MQRAIKASHLRRLANGGVKDLFIVAKPEVAAAFVISQPLYAKFIHVGERFALLDCGGRTVDAITYKVIQTDPRRLQEVVAPDGASCGSTFLNDRFHKLLESRLEGAKLVGNNTPLNEIIDSKVIERDNGQKRTIDITKKEEKFAGVFIPGLQADLPQRISNNRVYFDRREMKDVFKYCLRDVAKLLRDQLQSAKETIDSETGLGFNVQKVFLVGGFCESPSLQNHIQNVLTTEQNILNQPISLVITHHIDSAVARGAVLRALNKEDGPRRITRTSYRILRSDFYDSGLPEHRGLRGRRYAVDGLVHIEKCIHWQILKVGSLRCGFQALQ